MPADPPYRRGFTLMELLVVVGIIALLAAILLPALAQAKARAAEVKCGAQLRSWGTAFNAYATDFGGLFPHTGDRWRNPVGFENAVYWPYNESAYTYVLPPTMGDKSWLDYPFYQKPTGSFWQCPLAVPDINTIYSYDITKYGYHSYSANYYLDSTGTYPKFLTVSRVEQPSVTLLMFEVTLSAAATNGQGGPGNQQCDMGENCNNNPSSLGDRHPHSPKRLGGNLLMIDNHVEWTDRLWDPALADPSKPPATNRQWYPY